ncbi:MAG TPA: vWA domain-containing protein [Methylocella sp.]|nr:vWA domain-containing protein [Methylocella sp.]
MTLGLDSPMVLVLLPLVLAPYFFSTLRPFFIPSLDAAPPDGISRVFAEGLATIAAVAIAAGILALAGLHAAQGSVTRMAEGAEIVLLIDRSGSMNETFAGRQPSGAEESKTAAAKRILSGFFSGDVHDLVGVAAFSTSPMLVMPMTDHQAAYEAAIRAIDRPGLDYTNIARGLALALSMFKPGFTGRSRAILLVSDGAALIDPKIQEELRADFQKIKVNLYWLFLRTAGSEGITDQPKLGEDTPQAMPERHLDLYFKTLGVPYLAFEAEGPQAVTDAVTQIGRLERHPMEIEETLPRTDFTPFLNQVALLATLLLLAAKFAEKRMSAAHGQALEKTPLRLRPGERR